MQREDLRMEGGQEGPLGRRPRGDSPEGGGSSGGQGHVTVIRIGAHQEEVRGGRKYFDCEDDGSDKDNADEDSDKDNADEDSDKDNAGEDSDVRKDMNLQVSSSSSGFESDQEMSPGAPRWVKPEKVERNSWILARPAQFPVNPVFG